MLHGCLRVPVTLIMGQGNLRLVFKEIHVLEPHVLQCGFLRKLVPGVTRPLVVLLLYCSFRVHRLGAGSAEGGGVITDAIGCCIGGGTICPKGVCGNAAKGHIIE